jgi:hypothetical protein
VVDGDYKAVVFVAERSLPNARRSVEITYDRTGEISTQHQPPRESHRGPLVPAELQTDTRDPLTAFLITAVRNAEADACEAVMEIYDGRRRVDVTLSADGQARVPARFISWFRPGAHRCAISLNQRAPQIYVDRRASAGTTSGHRNGGVDLRPEPRRVTVARMQDGQIWMPIAAELDSSIGMLTVRLTDIRVEDRRLN